MSEIKTITRAELASASQEFATAIAAEKVKGGQKYILPNEELGILTEMLNLDNPIAAYTGVTISGQGTGSVEVKYDIYNDNWTKKTTGGSDTTGGDNVIIDDEIFRWGVPYKKEEKVLGYDLKRGVPNTLGSRMSTASVKFLQNSIKKAFALFVAKATGGAAPAEGVDNIVPGTEYKVIAGLDTSSRDKISQFKITLVQEITKFAVANEIDESDLIVTLNPTTFDALAENGLIGDRASQTFAGGQFSVGMLAGYKVQSGGMYIPTQVVDNATTVTKTGQLHAFVGTSKVGLHSVDFVAANAGKIGLSNDESTYLEMADIAGFLDYEGKFGKAQALVIGEALA